MTLQEFLVRMLVFIQPLLPVALAVLAVTTAAVLLLAGLSRNMRADQKRFQWLGLFFDLSLLDCARIGCAWLKLVLVSVYLIAFRSLTAADIILILVPSLLGAVRFHNVRGTIGNLLWLAVEFAALISTNLVCGFINTFSSGAGMMAIYVCMAVFTALLALFLFLTELGEISERRQPYVTEED